MKANKRMGNYSNRMLSALPVSEDIRFFQIMVSTYASPNSNAVLLLAKLLLEGES